MARYYQVISGDGHLETPPDTFVKYVPAKWKNRAPQLLRIAASGTTIELDQLITDQAGAAIDGR